MAADPSVSGIGMLPSIALPESIDQYSGARLAAHVMDALGRASLRIELPS
ncbi:hypothetical protein [Mycobacteroides chelonae]|nr:hypothetical protein [Mycobacteroides chelonae]